jgi:hypothetical protein
LVGWRYFEDIKDAAVWEKKYKNSHGQLERDLERGIITLFNRGR